MCEISVIIPLYNVERYINRCIDSVLAQTYDDFEIILINDGSSDRSGEICDAYAREHDRITVIHQENRGVSAARNAGSTGHLRAATANGSHLSTATTGSTRDILRRWSTP